MVSNCNCNGYACSSLSWPIEANVRHQNVFSTTYCCVISRLSPTPPIACPLPFCATSCSSYGDQKESPVSCFFLTFCLLFHPNFHSRNALSHVRYIDSFSPRCKASASFKPHSPFQLDSTLQKPSASRSFLIITIDRIVCSTRAPSSTLTFSASQTSSAHRTSFVNAPIGAPIHIGGI